MFGFLKDKLKSAISVFSKKAEEEAKDVEEPEEKKPQPKKEEPKKEPKKGANKPAVDAEEKKEDKKPEKTAKKEEKKEPEKKKPAKEEKKTVKEQETKKPSPKTSDKKITEAPKPEVLPAKTAEEETEDQQEEIPEEKEEKKGFFSRLKEKFTKQEEPTEEEPVEEEPETQTSEEVEEQPEKPIKESIPEKKGPISPPAKATPPAVEEPEEKKGFFGRIGETLTKKTLSAEKFEELFWEIEVALLESNVALSVIEKIKQDLHEEMVDKKVNRSEIGLIVQKGLSKSVREILTSHTIDIFERIEEKRRSKEPYVMCFVGVNGAGKTTTIAKFANFLKKHEYSCVIAAADTFRAAALEQLQTHTDNLGLKLIKHDYGSDAAAVAFDALAYAKQKGIDVVLVDTAGRLHSNVNLMGELEKVIRVSKADFVMFVGDALTGNDAVEQAEKYNSLVGVDGIILAKADVDEKGGATISTSYVIQKPVMFLGVGQNYDDFEVFDAEKILVKLGLA